jgi:hypothetical protein
MLRSSSTKAIVAIIIVPPTPYGRLLLKYLILHGFGLQSFSEAAKRRAAPTWPIY